jgi:hypothetical protein
MLRTALPSLFKRETRVARRFSAVTEAMRDEKAGLTLMREAVYPEKERLSDSPARNGFPKSKILFILSNQP